MMMCSDSTASVVQFEFDFPLTRLPYTLLVHLYLQISSVYHLSFSSTKRGTRFGARSNGSTNKNGNIPLPHWAIISNAFSQINHTIGKCEWWLVVVVVVARTLWSRKMAHQHWSVSKLVWTVCMSRCMCVCVGARESRRRLRRQRSSLPASINFPQPFDWATFLKYEHHRTFSTRHTVLVCVNKLYFIYRQQWIERASVGVKDSPSRMPLCGLHKSLHKHVLHAHTHTWARMENILVMQILNPRWTAWVHSSHVSSGFRARYGLILGLRDFDERMFDNVLPLYVNIWLFTPVSPYRTLRRHFFCSNEGCLIQT